MAGKVLLRTSLLPREAVSLGRLVVDINNPQRRYHDPSLGEATTSTVQVDEGVQETGQQFENKQVKAALSKLLALFSTEPNAHAYQVKAVLSLNYTLNQWEEVFREICALESTRRWLEDVIQDGRDVYFIVGYRTFVDPVTSHDTQLGRGTGMSFQLPLSKVAEANLPGIGLGGALNASVTHSQERNGFASRSSSTNGECVYAVQYCKLRFKWFTSRKVNSSLLGENKWRIYIGVRGEEEEDDEIEDDIVEAVLEDDWHEEGGVEL